MLLVVVSAGWIWAFPEASVFFVGTVLLHVVLGVVLIGAAFRHWRSGWMALLRRDAKSALAALAASALFGLVLGYAGATRPNLWIVQIHGAAGFLGVALLTWWAVRHAKAFAPWAGGAVVLALCLPIYVVASESLVPDAPGPHREPSGSARVDGI